MNNTFISTLLAIFGISLLFLGIFLSFINFKMFSVISIVVALILILTSLIFDDFQDYN